MCIHIYVAYIYIDTTRHTAWFKEVAQTATRLESPEVSAKVADGEWSEELLDSTGGGDRSRNEAIETRWESTQLVGFTAERASVSGDPQPPGCWGLFQLTGIREPAN